MHLRRSGLALTFASAVLLSACQHSPEPTVCPVPNRELCAMELEKGDLVAAETYCDLALEFYRWDPDAWSYKGLIALARGDRRKAKQHFLTALSHDKGHRQAREHLGVIAMEEAGGQEHPLP